MKELPLVTIIIPVYNAEKYLDQCIDSVIKQKYTNIEIILVDDGSDDESLEICNRYKKMDSRVIVISNPKKGAYNARKIGIQKANGKYVAFVDADDWIDYNMYYDLVHIIEEQNSYAVESGTIEVYEKHQKIRKHYGREGHYPKDKYIKEILPKMLYCGIPTEPLVTPTVWNKLFRMQEMRNIFDSIDNGGQMGNDAAVVYPFLTVYNDIFITKKAYYYHRMINNGSITRRKYEDLYSLLNVHINVIGEYFKNSSYSEMLYPQLQIYKMKTYIMYCPEIFDKKEDELLTFTTIYGGIKLNEKVVIYGAGKSGVRAYTYIKNYLGNNIIAWVDKNYECLSKEIDVNIKNPIDVDYNKVDKVVVTALKAEAVESIIYELKEMGIDEQKIKWIPTQYIENPKIALDLIAKR